MNESLVIEYEKEAILAQVPTDEPIPFELTDKALEAL